jgi:hypothetical protein
MMIHVEIKPERIDSKHMTAPILLKQIIEEKRRLRRGGHRLRPPESKILLTTAT